MFKCSNCGQCCGDWLPVSDREIKKIRNYIRKHKLTLKAGQGLACPFRDNENQVCMIYAVRPFICQTYNCGNKSGTKGNSRQSAIFGEESKRNINEGDIPVREEFVRRGYDDVE